MPYTLPDTTTLDCGPVCHSTAGLHHAAKQELFTQIKSFFSGLFNTNDWPPRWHCGNWTDFHGWLYIISDLSIFAAYFAIPLLLFRIVNKRKDIPFSRILVLFIAFILLCGTTHLLDAVIFWWPAYRLSALVRFATAVVSVFTVYALYTVMPLIYRLRTQDQLEAEIEERKKAEEEARHQMVLKQAAENVVMKKDEFMSIASHELKTPITSIKASLQLMERLLNKGDDAEILRPFVTKANKQVDKLTGIVRDLLEVTRIQAGKLALQESDFNLNELVLECVEDCRANNKQTILVNGDKAIVLHADRNRIDQVISNLLTNALKYSAGNTTVKIDFQQLKSGKIKLAVTDQGIGIPQDQLPQIFDRFYRVENTSQNFSGIGLGLYISSQIIQQHGGHIGVESEQGIGSVFWFEV